MDEALWRNVCRAAWFLARRLHGAGLELQWAGTTETVRARRGEPTARVAGPPGELLLYLFGRHERGTYRDRRACRGGSSRVLDEKSTATEAADDQRPDEKVPDTLSALAADRPAPVERGLEESQLRMNSPTTTRLRVPAALMLAHH